jgi:formyltetrahydrofolate-dependent phosphoribosylglycinamide formyltransferase
MQFIVLSSSRGTTFQAVIDRIADRTLTAKCLGLVSDREDRGCVAKAKAAGIPVKIVEKKAGESKEEYDRRIDQAMRTLSGAMENGKWKMENTIIAALGWMSRLTPWFVSTWRNRIINVHPSLLPKYPGLHAIRDALMAKENQSGMTIHIIDEGLDTGPKLVQKSCSISEGDTEETLKEKIQMLEKEWYPKVLQMIETGEMTLPS